jgi:hypothetical protein
MRACQCVLFDINIRMSICSQFIWTNDKALMHVYVQVNETDSFAYNKTFSHKMIKFKVN